MPFKKIADRVRELWVQPQFVLELRSEWSSRHEGGRVAIRAHLSTSLSPTHDMTDLKALPEHPAFSISISHNKELGGYCYVPATERVGFDIEIAERCSAKMVERVIHEDAELEAAPSPAALWTAKEAAFKALPRALQPPTVIDVEIGGWQDLGGGSHSFSIERLNRQNPPTSQGLIFTEQSHCLAFVRIPGIKSDS